MSLSVGPDAKQPTTDDAGDGAVGHHAAARSRLLPEGRSEASPRSARSIVAYLADDLHAGRACRRPRGDAKAVSRSKPSWRRSQWTQVETPRRGEDLQQVYRSPKLVDGHARLRLDGLGHGRRASTRRPSGSSSASRRSSRASRRWCRHDAAGDMEGVAGGAAHHERGAVPQPAVRRRALRVLRQDAAAASRRSGRAGSAACSSSTARWAKRSASSTSASTFPPAAKVAHADR